MTSLVHTQKISISYEYPIHFTYDVFSPSNPALASAISRQEPARCHRVFPLVDRGVADAWPTVTASIVRYAEAHSACLALADRPTVIEGGEAVKNDVRALTHLQEHLHRLGLDRQSFVLIVGGGSVLDMAGYAAAVTHRGLRVVRVPTTVLAQADAGIGVKNGVNAFGKKNFFGTFAPPFAVLNDSRFLETLGARDTVAGMGEAVKAALIKDADFFDWLSTHAGALAACRADAVVALIRRSAELHLDHFATSGDPFEFGSARPLDFGHWAAHKLESLTRHRLRHGEAVAIGIALDTLYSADVGLLEPAAVERVLTLLERLGLELWDESLDHLGAQGRPALLDGLAEFREHLGGQLTVTLLAEIGRGVEVHEISEGLVCRAMERLRRRAAST